MKVGLTGGMGCGKSTVGRILEENGLARLDVDVVVRELLSNDSEVMATVIHHFGEAICTRNGSIDRSKLARHVFQDDLALKWLEDLIHPRVSRVWRTWLQAHSNQDCVVEIPLLFEKNLETQFDLVVCVFCTKQQQLMRLAEKGFNRKMALARMSHQLPLEIKAQRADMAIFNNGNHAFLKHQTRQLFALFKQS